MNETIKTMLTQLLQSQNHGRLKAMLGTSKVVYNNDKNSVTFNFKMNRKVNHCTIIYNSLDLYDMEFYKVIKPTKANNYNCDSILVDTKKGLYNDMLKSSFENYTELRLSL